jgi:hypothetical protein
VLDSGATMGKVLWHVTMSLDGFIAGPGDAMDWAFRHAGQITHLRFRVVK